MIVEVDAAAEKLSEDTDALVVQAKEIMVVDHEHYEKAGEILKSLKDLKSQITNTFKPIKQAQDRAKKETLRQEKAALHPVYVADRLIREKMLAFNQLQEQKASEDVTEREAKADGISKQVRYAFEIVDVSKIDPSFMTPDEKKIGKTVRAMGVDAERVIGGIKVISKENLAVRS